MSNDANDIRVLCSLPQHPKTKKLIRRLDPSAGWYLIRMLLWARENRPDGDLAGMSAEDIELAVDWTGENDALVAALAGVGFLDGEEGAYTIHDWGDHNPWAQGAAMRSAKARWNAIKRHHGEAEADRQVPEYASVRFATSTKSDAISTGKDADSNARSTDAAMLDPERSNAPSPSPSPSPFPEKLESTAVDLSPEPAEPDSDNGIPRCPTRQIIALYHEILPELSPTHELPEQSAKHLRQRWRSDPERQSLKWWRDFFSYVRKCPFLMGEKTDFAADLLWLAKPTNFAKVLNGNYEERAA